MIVAFTGHRPNSLGGYAIPNPLYNSILCELESILTKLKPDHAISGMAIGLDQWAAEICIRLNIPFTAAIPFKGQEASWPDMTQKIYNDLLDKAEKTEYVSSPPYAAFKMHLRNEWMVDNCDIVLGVFNGVKSGGTYNCIKYAKSQNKEIYVADVTPSIVKPFKKVVI